MNSTRIVRYQVTSEDVAENVRLVEAVFSELAEQSPGNLRSITYLLDDGVTFMHVVESAPGDTTVADLASFQEFQSALGDRCVGPPAANGTTVVGSYNSTAS